MKLSFPRVFGYRRAPARQRIPEPSKYEVRHAMTKSHAGKAVAYSTEGPDTYAPFRGAAECTSRTGFLRENHEYDRDGVCYWCNASDRNR